ncbi:MAG: DMT family transporter [Microcystaceae cyanobacterium]
MDLAPKKPTVGQVSLILGIGVLMTSTSAILIRLAFQAANRSDVGFSLFLAASRLLFTFLLLIPTWPQLRKIAVQPRAYCLAIAAGLALAGHFATWISSLGFTSIAASAAIVTTNPVWVALLSWVWYREKLTKLTIMGIGIALGGGGVIAYGESGQGGNYPNALVGDLLALVGSWLASLYILWGREAQKAGLTIGQYILVAYGTAAIALFFVPFWDHQGYSGYPLAVYGYVLLMALFPQLIGHTSVNWAVRWIAPTFVTLAILFEPLGASVLGWLIFAEIPPLAVITGGLLLLMGVAIAVIGSKKSQTSNDITNPP